MNDNRILVSRETYHNERRFIKFLLAHNCFKAFFKNFENKGSGISYAEFLKTTKPESWISNAFIWGEKHKRWATLSIEWKEILKNKTETRS
jgi:hypothetical protein